MSHYRVIILEVLIAIFFVGILGMVLYFVFQPVTDDAATRDTDRWEDVTMLMDALSLSKVDNQGRYMSEIRNAEVGQTYLIGLQKDNCESVNEFCDVQISTPTNCLGLQELMTEGYIPHSFPVSLSATRVWSDQATGYYLTKNSEDSITVGACESETVEKISVDSE